MFINQVLLNFIDIFSGCLSNTTKLYDYLYYSDFVNSNMTKILMSLFYLIAFSVAIAASSGYFVLFLTITLFNLSRIAKLKKESLNKAINIEWSKYNLILATTLVPIIFCGVVKLIENYDEYFYIIANFMLLSFVVKLYLKQRKFTKKLFLEF